MVARPQLGHAPAADTAEPSGAAPTAARGPRLGDLLVDADLAAQDELRNVVPRDRAPKLYTVLALVVAAALAVVVPSLRELPAVVATPEAALWLMAAFAILVDARPFPGRAQAVTVFPSIAFTSGLLLGWGLAPAVIVQAIAVIVSSIRLGHRPWRAVYNQAQYALSFGAAAAVLGLFEVPRLAGESALVRLHPVDVIGVVLAGTAWFAVNHLLVSLAWSLRFGTRWRDAVSLGLRHDVRGTVSLLALGPLVVVAGSVSALLVPLILVPLLTVSELARFTAAERRKATLDELTGLPNRKALYGHMLAHAQAYGRRSRRRHRAAGADPRRMALLLMDIDQFRRVNEALGHSVGDQLLSAVADRLRSAIGGDGVLARLGGDEFAVLAPRLTDHEAASVLAMRVADALNQPVVLDGLPVDVTAAVGVAIYPDDGTDHITLLRHAEIAMYDAKDHGNSYAVYTPDADQHSPEKLALLADLRRAVDSGSDELQLHYQPQVDMATGEVVGTEALLRWNHPEQGFVSPERIIKVAEQTAVMRLITARVLEDAVGQLAKWRADGLMLRVSVNISARDLHRPEFVDDLSDLLADRGVPANQLQLEITEGAVMADPRRALITLHRLDKLGVALSLDDFGTGYSSLQHLRRLPLAEVKIDRSFVLGMTTDSDDAAVVRSVVDLSRALGLRVVAEGVEDDETRRALAECGCEVGQGWYFARPMPPDDFATWLATVRRP
jgi:diguanylate cyclase (GGDEF)-like protein